MGRKEARTLVACRNGTNGVAVDIEMSIASLAIAAA